MKLNDESRREFLIKALKLAGVSVAGISVAQLSSCENFIEKSSLSEGTEIKFDFSGEPLLKETKIGWGVLKYFPGVNYGIPLIIVRLSADEIACFSSMCTHAHCSGKKMQLSQGRTAGYREIICECHGSQFDPFLDGAAVKGPAEKPLKRFETVLDKENSLLYIKF